MVHYTCDCCKRVIDAQEELRFVLRMEVYAVIDEDSDDDDDRDHLLEIQDILERADDSQSDRLGDSVYQQLRFDLCPECRRKFLQNPLDREPAKQFNFSEN